MNGEFDDGIDWEEFEMDYIRGLDAGIEHDVEKLRAIAIEADRILRDELEKSSLLYDFAEVRIFDRKTVGVRGDARVYEHPCVVKITYKGKNVWDENFLDRLSTRITNEVKGIIRVNYDLIDKNGN